MSLRDIYLFAFSLGVVLALFSFFNLFALDFYSQILWGFIGVVLVIIGAVLLGKQSKPEKRATKGNAFYFFGVGIYTVLKGLAKNIGEAYRNSQERRKIEEQRREHGRRIYQKAYIEEMARQQAKKDAQERAKAEKWQQKQLQDNLPNLDEDFMEDQVFLKKRKKKRCVSNCII